jgi:hypothetical protein
MDKRRLIVAVREEVEDARLILPHPTLYEFGFGCIKNKIFTS